MSIINDASVNYEYFHAYKKNHYIRKKPNPKIKSKFLHLLLHNLIILKKFFKISLEKLKK